MDATERGQPARVRQDTGRIASAPKKRTSDQGRPSAPAYEPTDKECAVVLAWLARHKETLPLPWINLEASTPSRYRTSFDHPDPLAAEIMVANALGVHDLRLASVLRNQLANVARDGKVLTAEEYNSIIAIVGGIGPRDPTEALLATQMAAIHNATMVATRRLNHADSLAQQDSASNMLNKLTRTFATQIEALKRYRSNGEQTIKVQHVNVNEGGQAIIGNVTTQGGATKIEGQSHEPSLAPASGPALLGDLEANRAALPGPGGTRQEGVPIPRSTGGRAKRLR